MSPERMRTHDLMCLATRALEALGVNGNAPNATHIMEHSIAQACLELQAVEAALEGGKVDQLVYIVMGIRQRLEFAQNGAEMLATLIAEGSQQINV